MGIFKDTFSPFVHDQLYIRQSLAAFGNMEYGKAITNKDGIVISEGSEGIPVVWGSRMSNQIPIGTVIDGNDSNDLWVEPETGKTSYVGFRTEDDYNRLAKLRGKTIPSKYWHSWMLNKSCTVRMASMVDLVDDDILDLDAEFNGVTLEKELIGYGLARNYILEGGTLLNVDGMNEPTMREGFPSKGKLLGTAYGDPLSRSDGKMDDYGESYGIVPMPGIVSTSIKTVSAYGSLRGAKIEFTCHNLRQLSVMELLYMRPGYPVLLEWGWTPHIDNNGDLATEFDGGYVSDQNRFWGRNGTSDTTMQQQEINEEIAKRKKKNSGNYDGLLGLVKNFSYTARDDGGFNCTTELMGAGEIISSLKSNNTTFIVDTKPNPPPANGTVTPFSPEATPITVPSLLDFVLATFDYAYGVEGGDLDDDDYKKIERPGDDDVYDTEDDVEERGKYAHHSQRYIEQSTKKENWFGGNNRRETLNISKFETDEAYVKEFMTSTGNLTKIPQVYNNTHLLKFEDIVNSPFYKNMATATGFAVAGYPLLGMLYNYFTSKAIYAADSYIRLDALLFNINKRMVPAPPKGAKSGDRIVAYQTLHFNPHAKKGSRFEMHEFSSWGDKSKNILSSLWVDDDFEKPTGEYGAYSDHSGYKLVLDGSVDPSICLFPRQYDEGATTTNLKILGTVQESVQPVRNYIGYTNTDFHKGREFDNSFKVNEDTFDRAINSIGHIMVNVEFLMQTVYKLHNADELGIGSFVKEIITGINNASGGRNNLSIVTDNDFPQIANIVDLNKNPKSKYKDVFRFNVQSNDSCVTNFSFNTAIPTAMSSTIAVAACNPDAINSLDSVSFSSMNRGISNRLYRNTPSEKKKITDKEKKDQISRYRIQMHELSTLLAQMSIFQLKVGNGEYFSRGSSTEANSISNVRSIQQRALSIIDDLSTKNRDGSVVRNPTAVTPIPIKIDIELEGISGIVMGQMFRINESRLPKQYRHKKIVFIVVSEETNINTDGVWTTKIGGQMQLFPGTGIKLKAGGANPKPADTNVIDVPILGVDTPDLRNGQHWAKSCKGVDYIVKKVNNKFVPIDQEGRNAEAECNALDPTKEKVYLTTNEDWDGDGDIDQDDYTFRQDELRKADEARKNAIPKYDWNNDGIFDAEDKRIENMTDEEWGAGDADSGSFIKQYTLKHGGPNDGPLKVNPNK
jgi:hypothetical protein|tara:strand:- start:906 stop:4466 length:3561 start_codon:yes stop_codon:yes gene_type:complete